MFGLTILEPESVGLMAGCTRSHEVHMVHVKYIYTGLKENVFVILDIDETKIDEAF